jgi:hypothetical protein
MAMTGWTLPAPERWKIVSTAGLRERDIRRFLLPETAADIVIVEPRTEEAAADAVVDADIVIGDYLFEVEITARVIDRMQRCRLNTSGERRRGQRRRRRRAHRDGWLGPHAAIDVDRC